MAASGPRPSASENFIHRAEIKGAGSAAGIAGISGGIAGPGVPAFWYLRMWQRAGRGRALRNFFKITQNSCRDAGPVAAAGTEPLEPGQKNAREIRRIRPPRL